MNKDLHCYTPDTLTRKPTHSGPLDGLTFALKDLCDVEGHVASFGHSQWRATHEPATQDSAVLATLLDNGAELAGITKMDQLAFSLIGNVGEGEEPVNTKYPERYCGGSSSGSASAVAGDLVDFAVGSDTGGSVRVPAAVCGVYGIRTTHGLLDKSGVVPLAESCDVLGFITRDPQLLGELVGPFVDNQPNKPIERILVPADMSEVTTQEYAQAVKGEAERLAKIHNLPIEEVDTTEFVSVDARNILRNNQSRDIGKEHAEWAKANKQHLADDVRARLEFCINLAQDTTSEEKDKSEREEYTKKLVELIGDNSILCLPVMPESGPNRDWDDDKLAEFRGRVFQLSAPSSISGLPQVSAPISGSATNIGILGSMGSDLALISLFEGTST